MNETGLVILRLLLKNAEIEPVLAQLEQDYDISHRDAERDVLEFATALRIFIGDR